LRIHGDRRGPDVTIHRPDYDRSRFSIGGGPPKEDLGDLFRRSGAASLWTEPCIDPHRDRGPVWTAATFSVIVGPRSRASFTPAWLAARSPRRSSQTIQATQPIKASNRSQERCNIQSHYGSLWAGCFDPCAAWCTWIAYRPAPNAALVISGINGFYRRK